MNNRWTKEEIILTRRAWLMHDMDREYKFACVSWAVSIATMAFVAWVLL